jgi:hypothetical protein
MLYVFNQPFLEPNERNVPREIFSAWQQESLLHKEDEDKDENDAKGDDETI